MVYFKDVFLKLARCAIQTHDDNDTAEAAHDILRIECAEKAINNQKVYAINEAICLDRELREKYPTINALFIAANTMKSTSSNNMFQSNNDPVRDVQTFLRQDYYGILCHVALRKSIISEIKQFIDRVE